MMTLNVMTLRLTSPEKVLLGFVGGVATLITAGILVLTRGHFLYSLDDPFIHLSLARSISEGHYGVNVEWPSSPSSSILWPFLMAPIASTAIAEWVPIVVNLACTAATAIVLARSLRHWLSEKVAALVSGCAVLMLNVIGIAFTGMEHSLQVLLAALVTHGVLTAIYSQRVSKALVIAMILGPLVRYESAAVSVAAALVLILLGRFKVAAVTSATWIAILLLFSGFLVSLGLSPLPSSVLAKNNINGGTSGSMLIQVTLGRIPQAFRNPPWVAALVVAVGGLKLARRPWRLISAYMIVILMLHAIAGQFGWFGRYEVYALIAVLAPAIGMTHTFLQGRSRALTTVASAVLIGSAGLLATTTVRTPWAAQEMYLQQAQTARFVSDFWKRPIAVNDLGLVSYRGRQVTLDLWGLGDQESRKERAMNQPLWMDRLVAKHDIHLVAIFRSWFPKSIPSSWITVADFKSPANVTAVDPVVTFFVRDEIDAPAACEALSAWASTLPVEDSVALACPR
jgi:hypothetical protein